MTVDILMTVLSIILMGGTMLFSDEKIHQIFGMFLLFLWILHTCFNRRWYSSLLKGKYPPYRVMQITVNLGIAICALCLMASGMMMAWFMPALAGLGIARSIHLVSSHWYYIFMSVHIGMHLSMIFSRIKASGHSFQNLEKSGDADKKKSVARKIALNILLFLICAYGISAFILRGIWKYIFLSQQFFFFDLERGYFLFAVDYLSILILIAAFSYFLGKFLQKKKSPPKS